MNEPHHAYERVMSHIRMSHVAHMNVTHNKGIAQDSKCTHESCHTQKELDEIAAVTKKISHLSYIQASCGIYEGVMLHV